MNVYVFSLPLGMLGSAVPAASRTTHNTLEAIAVTSLAATSHVLAAIDFWVLSVQTQAKKVPWLRISRAWDFTPMEMNFGKLAPLVRPIASYWWRDIVPGVPLSKQPAPTWSKLDFEEFQRRREGELPAKGVLELGAQTFEMTWAQE